MQFKSVPICQFHIGSLTTCKRKLSFAPISREQDFVNPYGVDLSMFKPLPNIPKNMM